AIMVTRKLREQRSVEVSVISIADDEELDTAELALDICNHRERVLQPIREQEDSAPAASVWRRERVLCNFESVTDAGVAARVEVADHAACVRGIADQILFV